MSDFLYSVKETFATVQDNPSDKLFLKKHNKTHYNIPEYQRGYKWETTDVNTLLNDINDFKGNPEEFYCLQNITLVNKNGYYNVVDGQQRLTTLYIILAFLGEHAAIKRKITYPENTIRAKTYEFLNKFILDRSEIDVFSIAWDVFNKATKYEYNYQDIFFLCSTARTVKEWFDDKEENEKSFRKDKFTTKLLENVKLIINNLQDTNEEKVFDNVNSKRVPLDGSDLVRAIIITKYAKEETNISETDNAGQIKINELRVRIGWELDQINNWWQNHKVQEYFSSFISVQQEGDVKFDRQNYPINYLYFLYAEREGLSKLSLQLLEQKNVKELYNAIIDLQANLKEWYEDIYIYHYMGFLMHYGEKSTKGGPFFRLAMTQWSAPQTTRDGFIKYLECEIKKVLLDIPKESYLPEDTETLEEMFSDFMPEHKLSENDKTEEENELIGVIENDTEVSDKNWYDEYNQSLIKTLMFLDINHVLKQNEKNISLPPHAFRKDGKDIEHIFPQTPEDKNTDDLLEFVVFLKRYYASGGDKEIDIIDFENRFNIEIDFTKKIKDFIKKYAGEFSTHSLGNLVLLDASLNRSIKRIPYAQKRLRLIKLANQGAFIHPHTFNVFVRNFLSNDKDERKDLEFWMENDIIDNYNAVRKELRSFILGC